MRAIRPRWRTAALILGTLGLAVPTGLLVFVLWVEDLTTASSVAQLVAVAFVVPTLAIGLANWWRRSASSASAVTTANIAEAEDVLAGLVAEQWKVEAALRSLDDPDPIPVQWRLTNHEDVCDSAAWGPGVRILFGSSDRIDELTERFRALRRRRLVILGGPGTGKTTLAVQLLIRLLATRRNGEPVPVLLSVAGWNTEEFPRFHDWLTSRLRQYYPALRATCLGDDAPRTLVARGRILPVLDGFDELSAPARSAVITALNRSLGDEDQLMLSSRTEEFDDAVDHAWAKLNSAAVIEPKPLPSDIVVDYLLKCLPSRPGPAWERVANDLRTATGPASTLSEVASTPLGLWLLRTVYVLPGADPTQLLDPGRFPTVGSLRAHLFDQVIPSLVRTRPPSSDPAEPFRPNRHHDPDKVRHWLGFLATHLSRMPGQDGQPGTRDFAWWRLAQHSLERRTLPRAARLIAGVTVALAYWFADAQAFGPAVAIASWLMLGAVGGLVVSRGARSWSGEDPGFADFHVWERVRLLHRLIRRNATIIGLVALGAGTIFVVPTWVGFWFWLGPRVRMRSGRVLEPVEWFAVGGASIAFWLVTGLCIGLARGVAEWVEAPTLAGRASSPTSSWRADRRLSLARSIVAGLAAGLTVVAIWLVFLETHWLADTLVFGRDFSLAKLLLAWTVIGYVVGLAGGRHHAWVAYTFGTCVLAYRGHLPRDLMSFLDDAHRLGLLRAVGPIYQFRHAELQEHLAATFEHRHPAAAPVPDLTPTSFAKLVV